MPDGIGIARLSPSMSLRSHKYFRAQLFFGETVGFESIPEGRRAILEEARIGMPEAIQTGYCNTDQMERGKVFSKSGRGGSGRGEASGDAAEERPEEGNIGLRLDSGRGEGGAFCHLVQFGIEAMLDGIMVAFGGTAAARGGFVHESMYLFSVEIENWVGSNLGKKEAKRL